MEAGQDQGQCQNEGQGQRMKNSDIQILVTLLFITFSFLILTAPAFAGILYFDFTDPLSSAKVFAGFRLYHSLAQKLYFTNYGINFYLYVISGKKFRTDLLQLFKVKREESNTNIFVITGSSN